MRQRFVSRPSFLVIKKSKMWGKWPTHWTIASVLFWVADLGSCRSAICLKVWSMWYVAALHSAYISTDHWRWKYVFSPHGCFNIIYLGFDSNVKGGVGGSLLCNCLWTPGGTIWLFITSTEPSIKGSPVQFFWNPEKQQYKVRPQKFSIWQHNQSKVIGWH